MPEKFTDTEREILGSAPADTTAPVADEVAEASESGDTGETGDAGDADPERNQKNLS